MADQLKPATGDKALESIIDEMLKGGSSQEDIARVVQAYDDEQHPLRAMLVGGSEGVVKGVGSAITAPWDMAKGAILDAISMSKGESPENAKAFLDSIHDLPKRWNEGGPRERAEIVGTMLGQAGTSGAAARFGPGSAKGVIRTVGRGVQYAGEHPFATRMAGGAMAATGLYHGDPGLMAAGIGATAIPPVLKSAGQKLRIAGGESPAVVRLGPKGVADLTQKFDEAMVKRGMGFHDEQAKLAAEARKVQTIEEMKKGTVAQPPTVTESVRGMTPEGVQQSATIKFGNKDVAVPPGMAGGLSAVEVASLRKQGYSPEMIARLGKSTAAPIRVTGPSPNHPMTPTDIGQAEVGTLRSGAGLPGHTASEITPVEPTGGTVPQAARNEIARTETELAPRVTDRPGPTPEPPPQALPLPSHGIDPRDQPPPSGLTPESGPMTQGLIHAIGPDSTTIRVAAPRIPLGDLPPSRTSGAMSSIPGISANDYEFLKTLHPGMDPERILRLDPEIAQKLIELRRNRAGAYPINAGLDKGMKQSLDRDPGE